MNSSSALIPRQRQVLPFFGWLILCFCPASTAIFVVTDGWYAGLYKPWWNPPSWLFGYVWSLLYPMMAVAAWLVWREGGWQRQKHALILFMVQWLLNLAWTPIFFGLDGSGRAIFGMARPLVAFYDILLLWVALVATVKSFRRVKKSASVLLLPYLAWVTFAAVLNFVLWQMNWEKIS